MTLSKTKTIMNHTTNYSNTFIQVADDSKAVRGEVPPLKGESKSIAQMQFELLFDNPYKYTSDEVLFQVFAWKKEIGKHDLDDARVQYFSKGQPCFRASPLTKQYGWGVHSNAEGKIAIYGCETAEYERFSSDSSLKVIRAMKSKR